MQPARCKHAGRGMDRPPDGSTRASAGAGGLLALALCAVAVWCGSASAQPLNVQTRPFGQTVSRWFGPSGGSLVLRSEQARFRLVIPRGALFARTRIRMRAVAPAKGWPLGRTLAVQLSPEGIRLARLARLELVPKRPLPVRRRAPVAWQASGKRVHLYPQLLSRKVLAVPVWHFSGYGWADGSSGQWTHVDHRGPLPLSEQVEATVGKTIADGAKRGIDPSSQAFKDAFAESMLDAFAAELASLKAAEQGGDWHAAVTAAGALDSLLTLYGQSDGQLSFGPPETSKPKLAARLQALAQALRESFWRVYDNAYAREKAACASTHRYQHAARMMQIATELALLGNPAHAIPVSQLQQDTGPCSKREKPTEEPVCRAPHVPAWLSPDGTLAPIYAEPKPGDLGICWPQTRSFAGTWNGDESFDHTGEGGMHYELRYHWGYKLNVTLTLARASVWALGGASAWYDIKISGGWAYESRSVAQTIGASGAVINETTCTKAGAGQSAGTGWLEFITHGHLASTYEFNLDPTQDPVVHVVCTGPDYTHDDPLIWAPSNALTNHSGRIAAPDLPFILTNTSSPNCGQDSPAAQARCTRSSARSPTTCTAPAERRAHVRILYRLAPDSSARSPRQRSQYWVTLQLAAAAQPRSALPALRRPPRDS